MQKVRDKALKKAAAFKRLFATPDGKIVLKELADEFGEPPINVLGDSHATHVRVGQLDVLRYIHEIMEIEDA